MTDHWPDADWNLFALGAVEETAHRRMEEHLRSNCADCRHRYQSAIASMAALASTVTQVEPPAGVSEALLARIAGSTTKPLREPVKGKPLAPVVVLASRPVPEPVRVVSGRIRWNIPLPWVIAAGLALLALWLGVSLRRTSRELEISREGRTALPGISSSPSIEQQRASSSRSATVVVAAPSNAVVPVGKATDDARLRTMRDQLAQAQAERDAAIAQLQDGKNLLAQAEAQRKVIELQLADAREQERQLSARQVQAVRGTEGAELASLGRELDQANATIAKLRAAAGREDRILAFFRAGPSRQIDLRGVDSAAGGATGTAYYAPDRGLVVLVRNLPQLQDGKCYQLWSIHKSGTAIMSVGLVAMDGAGSGYLFADASSDLHQLSGLAITDEPKGGSISARGRKLLFGMLN